MEEKKINPFIQHMRIMNFELQENQMNEHWDGKIRFGTLIHMIW